MDGRFLRLVAAALLVLWAAPARAQSVTTTGTLAAAGDVVTIPVVSVPTETVQVLGTWTGATVFEATVDGGSTWWPITVVNQADGSQTNATQANGLFLAQNVGFTGLRVRAIALTSGSAAVTATRGYGGGTGATVIKGIGPTGAVVPASMSSAGEVRTASSQGLPLPLCNQVLRTNCVHNAIF